LLSKLPTIVVVGLLMLATDHRILPVEE